MITIHGFNILLAFSGHFLCTDYIQPHTLVVSELDSNFVNPQSAAFHPLLLCASAPIITKDNTMEGKGVAIGCTMTLESGRLACAWHQGLQPDSYFRLS